MSFKGEIIVKMSLKAKPTSNEELALIAEKIRKNI